MADKRFIGSQYPIINTPRGLIAQNSDVDQIKADLLQLLLTNPGERVMLPEYGTPLRKLLFEPNDETLAQQARLMIANSIHKWEPRIAIKAIEVSSRVDDNILNTLDTKEEKEGILSIMILFVDPTNISVVEELKLEVPLGGS